MPAAPLSVLSVQTPSLGNREYGQTVRMHFEASRRFAFRGAWVGEDRTLAERLLYRAMDLRVPLAAVSRANADLRRARNEAAMAMLARGAVGRHAAREGRPDVLHFHTQVAGLMSARWMRRIPTVLTTDASARNHAAIERQPPWTHAPSVALDRRAFRAAAVSVFFSAWARDSAVDAYGLDPARVRVLPPGVPTERFAVPDRAARTGPVKLLFVGNRVHDKGGGDVLAVFAEHLADRAELHLVTGDALGATPPGVVVHRGVSAYSPEWFALYAAADVFVLPTRIDPFGLVFIEAMAAGLPVVGTRLNAVPEIVDDGRTGLLVPPGDRAALAAALDRLVGSADVRHRMGAAARARAETHFDLTINFDRLGDAFETALALGPPP